ncbi:hypothetical protein [Brevundimonas nasdae]|uniref:DUF4365 domain-containing protein n=1 Tax=Brevundimonas nasdae TaxID=172043 RepID=A0ABX8TJR8_9CAUL|nr:hypothetical protein [Brevundimonas nasdae]QYC11436.1 hypothetical protein KWG56_05525 [Brevundimonas nasdae]QYC14224.1 hypothetical protein KWG63_00860 [Brevundimonas nasdae]
MNISGRVKVSLMSANASAPRYSKLAETAFEDHCHAVGAICNRVSDDQTGWDYLVEFQPMDDPDTPHDLRPAPQKVFVQVKHSTREPRETELKLSNALRYCEGADAWFVMFFAYRAGATRPYAAYLHHVWKPLMAETLRASRQAHVTGKKLNRVRLPLRFNAAEKCSGNPLDDILSTLRTIGPAYGQQKKQVAAGLGYEDGPAATGSITLAEGVTESELVDLMLGIRDSIPLDGFKIVDQRFGIPFSRTLKGPATLSVTPQSSKTCLVTLRRTSSNEEVSWPGQILVPGIPDLAREHQRMRILAGAIEILLQPDGTANFNWSMPIERRQPIAELSRQLAFRSWADEGDLELEIWADGRCLTVANMTLNEAEPERAPFWADVQRAFATLMSIAPMERVPPSLEISLGELVDELDEMLEFSQHLDGAPGDMTIKMSGPPLHDIGNTRRLIMPLCYELADHAFIAVVERTVAGVRQEDMTIMLEVRESRTLRGAIMPGRAEDHRLFISQQVEWAEKRASGGDGQVMSVRMSLSDSGTRSQARGAAA